MPILSKVDHEKREIWSLAVGPINRSDAEAHLLRMKEWDSLGYREFFDARGTGPDLDTQDLRSIVEMLRELSAGKSLGRTAVLVSNDVGFQAASKFAELSEGLLPVRVFRDEEEARAWLNAKPANSAG